MATPRASGPRRPGPAAQTFALHQRFSVSPDELWPYVSDTDRINRSAGVAEASGTYEAGEAGRVLIGRAKQLGFTLEWVEHPFEHVAGERLGVLREYRSGPLMWMRSVVELSAIETGGTALTQTWEAQPRSLMYAPLVAAELGVRLRRAFGRTYRRLDHWLSTPPHLRPLDGPFAPRRALSAAAERELERGLSTLYARGVGDHALAALESTLRLGDPTELAQLRPLELAWKAGVPEDEMIDACLIAADVGLLHPRWELLCPHCRVAAQRLEDPAQLDVPGFCEACDVAIGVDPMSSVELVLRPNPVVCETQSATYCLGAPAHLPHVVAQQLVAQGERLELKLRLAAGEWAVTAGADLFVALEVVDGAPSAEAEVPLAAPPERLSLAASGQLLIVSNDTPQVRRVRVESAVMRASVLTAARAAARSLSLSPESFEMGAAP